MTGYLFIKAVRATKPRNKLQEAIANFVLLQHRRLITAADIFGFIIALNEVIIEANKLYPRTTAEKIVDLEHSRWHDDCLSVHLGSDGSNSAHSILTFYKTW